MYLKIKRIFDIILSILLIIILLPFIIIISIILLIIGIKNPIYIQDRTGKNNIVFKIYKFRTINKNKEIPLFCKILRNTGLDEILQIFNILKGDMSFVGPRPWIVDYSKHYNKKQRKRLNVLPGLTGLAQITECKNIFDKIEKDIYYVNNISFKLDISIFLSTIKMLITGNKKDFGVSDISEEIYLLSTQKKKVIK